MELAREQFTLICRNCAAVHTREMVWVQVHSFLRCDKCGAQQPVDKDAAMIELANRELDLRNRVGGRRSPIVPDRRPSDSRDGTVIRSYRDTVLDWSDA